MEPGVLALLALAAFVAAIIDSVVGGGGTITLPALLAAGLPPHLALGTNKMAATGASLMATVRYGAAGTLHLGRIGWLLPLAFGGSLLGAGTALQIPAEGIRRLVLVVLGAMVVWVLVRPGFGMEERLRGSMRSRVAMGVAALAIGFYDGLLGPGTGSLLLFAFVAISGMGLFRASLHGRPLNFVSNVAALAFFAGQGQVDVAVGAWMLAGTLAGGFVGSHLNLRHGGGFVRPLFLVITIILMVRLLWP